MSQSGSKRTGGLGQFGLEFRTNFLQRMLLTNDGKVAIAPGGTAPTERLEVGNFSDIANESVKVVTAGSLFPPAGERRAGLKLRHFDDTFGSTIESVDSNVDGCCRLNFRTHAGSSAGTIVMTLDTLGNAGVGTISPVDKLQVVGDIRVGTTGTNGCVKRFDGTAIAGTCSSDARFKKDVTPFAATLGALSALQPVHYYWRANEFPERHFGEGRTYGLIAQDVEQVFPDLVVTADDGYKAVDYSKLPLLTIQAVKELKSENDVLKAENAALVDRMAELERLVKELLTQTPRQ